MLGMLRQSKNTKWNSNQMMQLIWTPECTEHAHSTWRSSLDWTHDSAYQCQSMTSTDELTSWCLRQTGPVLSTDKTRSQLANLVKAGQKKRKIFHGGKRYKQQSSGVHHHTTIWWVGRYQCFKRILLTSYQSTGTTVLPTYEQDTFWTPGQGKLSNKKLLKKRSGERGK